MFSLISSLFLMLHRTKTQTITTKMTTEDTFFHITQSIPTWNWRTIIIVSASKHEWNDWVMYSQTSGRLNLSESYTYAESFQGACVSRWYKGRDPSDCIVAVCISRFNDVRPPGLDVSREPDYVEAVINSQQKYHIKSIWYVQCWSNIFSFVLIFWLAWNESL